MIDPSAETDAMASADVEADDLPEFLARDGEDEDLVEEEEQHMVAAE